MHNVPCASVDLSLPTKLASTRILGGCKPLPQQTPTNLANTEFPTCTFSYRTAFSNTPLLRAHPKWYHKAGGVQMGAPQTGASNTSKGLLLWEEKKRTIHINSTAAPAVGWELRSALTASPTHKQVLLKGQHRESTLQLGATASLSNVWFDSTQVQGSPTLAH